MDAAWDKVLIGIATFGTSVGTPIGIAVLNGMRRKQTNAALTDPLKEEDEKQQKIIEELTRRAATLEKENAELRARVGANEHRLSFLEQLYTNNLRPPAPAPVAAT